MLVLISVSPLTKHCLYASLTHSQSSTLVMHLIDKYLLYEINKNPM